MSSLQTKTLYWDRVPVTYVSEPGYYTEEEVRSAIHQFRSAIHQLLAARPHALKGLPAADFSIDLFKAGPNGGKLAGISVSKDPKVLRKRGQVVLAEAASDESTETLLYRITNVIQTWVLENTVS